MVFVRCTLVLNVVPVVFRFSSIRSDRPHLFREFCPAGVLWSRNARETRLFVAREFSVPADSRQRNDIVVREQFLFLPCSENIPEPGTRYTFPRGSKRCYVVNARILG